LQPGYSLQPGFFYLSIFKLRYMNNTTFQWSDFPHFVNTVKKRIREQLGEGFDFEELGSICSFLYVTSQELDMEIYLNPTGAFIAEIKQVKTPTQYIALMRKYYELAENESSEYFRIGQLHLKGKTKQTLDDIIVRFLVNGNIKVKRDNANIPDNPGVYFLYDNDKQLVYIGKSQCLSTRVYSSWYERKAVYIRIMQTRTKADANIIEPYCIALYNPIHNSEFKTGDSPTFVLDLPELGDFFKLEIIEE